MTLTLKRRSFSQSIALHAIAIVLSFIAIGLISAYSASYRTITHSYQSLLADTAKRLEEDILLLQEKREGSWTKRFAHRTEMLPYRVAVYDGRGNILTKNATPSYAPDTQSLQAHATPNYSYRNEHGVSLSTYIHPLPEQRFLTIQLRHPPIVSAPLYLLFGMSLLLSGLVLFPIISFHRQIRAAIVRLRDAMIQIKNEETLMRPRVKAEHIQEIHDLYHSFHALTISVAERVRAIMRQRNELDVVLEGMVEAVIAIDNEKRLLNANHSAEELFEMQIDLIRKKPISDIIRNNSFLEFIDRALNSSSAIQQELTVSKEEDQYFQAQASPLHDPDGNASGVVLVLNDVTHLRHLQRVRQDFVANVSHELRTPITSIKGFLETLSDGALENPTDARRFVDIALQQTQRLTAIIDDLLALSRIEQNPGQLRDTFEKSSIAECIESAIQLVELRAKEKGISIESRYPEDCYAVMSPTLMEQALVNLIENAIKYSEANTRVKITAEEDEQTIIFRVTDSGNGIEAHHLPRLFERFYRIDRARSRKVGGTGLGLSIVRHIAQVHGGHPEVVSTIGKGSTFSISIPREPS